MQLKKIKSILYICSILFLLIPSLLVLMFDITIKSWIGTLSILIFFTLFILGKIINILEKKKNNLKISTDIGAVLGVLTAMIWILLNKFN